jgi:hypothetical protein
MRLGKKYQGVLCKSAQLWLKYPVVYVFYPAPKRALSGKRKKVTIYNDFS